jgi:hypothetical protein
MSRIKSKWDNTTKKDYQNNQEVFTTPNQAMSIRDILFRNTSGLSYDNYKTPYYEEQATFSSQALNKIQDMEPVEKLQYLGEVQSQVSALKKKIKDHEEAKAQAVAEAQQKVEAQNTTNEQTQSE